MTRGLARKPGGPVPVSAERAGLVHRLRVVVFRSCDRNSRRERIDDGYPDVSLEKLASRTFDGGLQLLEYRPLCWPDKTTSGRRYYA